MLKKDKTYEKQCMDYADSFLKPPVKKLTAKQETFCRQYLKDHNATQSAIRAGYSEDTAGAIGCENLTKLEIQVRLSELEEQQANFLNLEVSDICSDLQSVIDDPETSKKDKVKAMELKGKLIGAFVDRSEVAVTLSKELIESAERVLSSE